MLTLKTGMRLEEHGDESGSCWEVHVGHDAHRRAVYEVVDITEGHGEGIEGQDHALVHIALLEAVASLAHAVTSTLQLVCRQHND